MRRRFAHGMAGALLSAGILAGALVGAGWASTKAVRLRVDAVRVPLLVACPAATPSPGCRITLELRTTADSWVRGGTRVGRTNAVLAPGSRRRIMVWLTPLGRRFLHRHSPLALVATTVVTMPPSPPPASPPTAATTPTTPTLAPPCSPMGSPVYPPVGPGPDGMVGGSITGAPLNPLDCVG